MTGVMKTGTISLVVLMILSAAAYGGGRKGSKAFFISFHVEGENVGGSRRVVADTIGGRQVYFKRSPAITSKDIEAYWPFPADDGTFGVALKLNARGRRELQTLGIVEQGKLLRAVVSMRLVDTLVIDQAPNDGTIVIWRGVTEADLAKMAKMFKQMGEGL